jgi:hypothetical protein
VKRLVTKLINHLHVDGASFRLHAIGNRVEFICTPFAVFSSLVALFCQRLRVEQVETNSAALL